MPSFVNQFGPLVGRILITSIFLVSGIGKIGNFAGTAGYMASKGIPMANILLVITIIIELGASAMIVLGYRARWAAAALFLWMIPVTFIFHNFWASPAAEKTVQSIMFYKNLGLMGGLLFLMAFGAGALSICKNK